MWVKTCVCLCVVVFLVEGGEEFRLVRTAQGPVRGYKDPDGDFYAFYGIPYATAPTGEQRFQAPLPPTTWLEPMEATDKGIVCPQIQLDQMSLENKIMQEDCLVANVYVPDTEENKLPVVVFVHGGGFQIGFGDLLPPKSFVNAKKVVAVTFNYRLGVNGFLCLGTKGAPGNAGLKDQVALLKWVKKNIVNFGGNPDDVTIAGCSAGSVSVDLLMISKSAKNLFHKVVPESGSSVAPTAVQIDPLQTAKMHAKRLNFSNVDDVHALEEFYISSPLNLLMTESFQVRTDFSDMFTPCVERDVGEDTFLEDAPVNLLKTGNYNKVAMLHGFDNMEGLMCVQYFDLWKSIMDRNFSEFLPLDLQFDSEEEREEVAKTVKEFYFGDRDVGEDNILEYIEYFTDIIYAYPTVRAVNMHAEAGNNQVYLYEYSFTDDQTPLVPYTKVRGAAHCSQTFAVLDDMALNNSTNTITEEYKEMKKIMRELWYNFIITGKPVPEGSSLPAWPPATAKGSPYMALGTTVQLKDSLLERQARFWDDIYMKHYRAPAPPPAVKTHSEL